MSAPSLCSAFAIADSSTFLMMVAPFFGLNCRMFSAVSTFFIRWASMNGPFFNERVMSYPLFLAATRNDHRRRTLVRAGLLALRLLAPWRHRMTTRCRTTFTTTVRVVDRVHHHTADG